MTILTITPVILESPISVVLDDGVLYTLIFSRNNAGNFYVVDTFIDDTLVMRRKVVSGGDIFAGRAPNVVYAQDADLIETGDTHFVIE